MIDGYSINFESPIYIYFVKHFCPRCNNKLCVGTDSVVINSSSPLSRKHDLSIGDYHINGNIKVSETMFYCKECNFKASSNYMKLIEFADRKLPRVYEHKKIPLLKRFKKVYCNDCDTALYLDYKRVIVDSETLKRKGYKIKGKYATKNYSGDVEFIECFYRCDKCTNKIDFSQNTNRKHKR